MNKFNLLIVGMVILGVCNYTSLYGKISERSCFSTSTPTTETPTTHPRLGTRFLIDHDHAAVALGAVFTTETEDSAWVPYLGLGEAFFPSGLTWQSGLAYCYRTFSIRLGYEGKYDIPSEPGEEFFPVIHTGYLISDLDLNPVFLSFLLKYGETWESIRAPDSSDYFKAKLNATEIGLFVTSLIIDIPQLITGLSVYTVAAFLTDLDEWTLNSLLTIDSTVFPIDWGEAKLIAKIIHTASSDTEQILTIKNMFFLGPFPAAPTERSYEYETSGYLSGDFALGYRFFPFYKFKKSSADWAGGFYLAPYLHYGWGIDRLKPIELVETTVGVSLHFGYKLPGTSGSISSSVGWNNRQGFVITVISNF